jgi:hypothetical protein
MIDSQLRWKGNNMADVISLFGTPTPEPEMINGIEVVTFQKDEVIEAFLNKKDEFDDVVIIASSKDGKFYFASSSGDIRQTLYDIESAKHMLMNYGSQFHPTDEDYQ